MWSSGDPPRRYKKSFNNDRRWHKEEDHTKSIVLFLIILWCLKNSIMITFLVEPTLNDKVPKNLDPVLIYNLYNFLSISYLPQILIIPCFLNSLKLNSIVTSAITIIIFSFLNMTSYPNDGYFDYNLGIDLNRNMYGQDNAINNLTRLLEYPKVTSKFPEGSLTSSHSGLHVILLSGGPGTGKSYMANIIEKHYSAKHTVHQIIPTVEPLSEEKTLLKTKQKLLDIYSGFGFIIIDSIKVNDKSISSYLKLLSIFCEKYKKDLFVILIIETLQIYSHNDIIGVDHFISKDDYFNFLNKKTVEFEKQILKSISNITYNSVILEPLTASDVKKCLDVRGNSELNSHKLQQISQNRGFVLSGCKEIQ